MSDNSIIALSEKRGEKRGLPRGIELGETLLEMLAGELADVLDFERVEQLDRSFISDELSEQESDMIFSVPLREPTAKCEEVIIYILIAQESTVDPLMMGFRLLSYMMRIWMEERRSWIERKLSKTEWRLTPIVPVVFYIGPGAWKSPLSLTALMDLPDTLKSRRPRGRGAGHDAAVGGGQADRGRDAGRSVRPRRIGTRTGGCPSCVGGCDGGRRLGGPP